MVITKYFKFSESPLHQINNHLHTSLVRIKQTYRGQSYRQTAGGHTKKQTDRQTDDGGRMFVQTEKLPVLGVLHLSYTSHYRICNTKHVHIRSSGIRVTRPHMTWFPRISNGKSKPWKSLFFSLNKYYGTFSQKVNLKLLINNKCICCGDNSKDITVSKYSLSNPICEYAIYGVNEIIDRRLRTMYIHLLLKRKQETGLSVICWDSDVQV